MDPTVVALGIASFFCFAIIGLEEVPWSFNEKRLERKVRRMARRKGTSQLVALQTVRGQTRVGAWVLLGFSFLALGFTVTQRFGREPMSSEFLVIAGSMVAGMFALSFAFLGLAPKLFDKVAKRLVAESATTNSHASDAELPHGPRP